MQHVTLQVVRIHISTLLYMKINHISFSLVPVNKFYLTKIFSSNIICLYFKIYLTSAGTMLLATER